MTSSLVGPAAWLELLHAEVCWTLECAGINVLVIKGPTIGDWLYPDEHRPSADVDLLLSPDNLSHAVEVFEARGFEATYQGTREGEIGGEHSIDLWRLDPELGRHGIDIHQYFPGIETNASRAFEVLWDQRIRSTQAGIQVWFPSHPARLLIIALHAAREPGSAKTTEDLKRALAALDNDGLEAAAQLARQLDCQGALKAGLETRDDTAPQVQRLGLSDVVISPEWELTSHGADLTALRLNQLADTSWSQRPAIIFRLVFPSPALMRYRDPRASEGAWGLTRAYGVRLGQGLKSLPGAVRAVREARRSH